MYLKIDLASPLVGEYLLNSRAKNRVLAYWDKTTINGTEVFDRLYLYKDGVVQETPNHLKLYQLMGIDLDELKAASYEGVEKTWLHFKYYNMESEANFTNQELFDYTHEVCAEDVTYTIILNMISQYNQTDTILGGIDRKEYVQSLIDAGFSSNDWEIIQNKNNNPAAFVALQDTDEVLFDRTTIINITDIEEIGGVSKYGVASGSKYSTVVKVEMKLKPATLVGDCTALFDKVRGSDFISGDFLGYVNAVDSTGLFISEQKYYDYDNGGTHNAIGELDNPIDPADNPTLYHWYLTTQGVQDMKVKDFGKLLQESVESDYEEEEADFWAKVLNFIIIIIAVAVIIVTGGAAAAAATGFASLTAFATVAATTLTITMVAQMVLAYAFQQMGEYGAAILMGKTMVIVQSVAKVLGYIALFTNILTFLQKGFTKAIMNEAGQEIGRRVLTSTEISMQILSWLKQGMSEYTNYEQEKNLEDERELQALLDEQEEMMMVAMTPKAMDLVQYNFNSYQFLEANEMMDNIPYTLTQGKIDSSTTKYYS